MAPPKQTDKAMRSSSGSVALKPTAWPTPESPEFDDAFSDVDFSYLASAAALPQSPPSDDKFLGSNVNALDLSATQTPAIPLTARPASFSPMKRTADNDAIYEELTNLGGGQQPYLLTTDGASLIAIHTGVTDPITKAKRLIAIDSHGRLWDLEQRSTQMPQEPANKPYFVDQNIFDSAQYEVYMRQKFSPNRETQKLIRTENHGDFIMGKMMVATAKEAFNQAPSDISQEVGRLLFLKALECIHAIHAQNFIHRNLDVNNFLLDKKGHLVVDNFDSATPSSFPDCFIGKYFAPEMVDSSSEQSAKSDIFKAIVSFVDLYGKQDGQGPFTQLGEGETNLKKMRLSASKFEDYRVLNNSPASMLPTLAKKTNPWISGLETRDPQLRFLFMRHGLLPAHEAEKRFDAMLLDSLARKLEKDEIANKKAQIYLNYSLKPPPQTQKIVDVLKRSHRSGRLYFSK